MFLAGRNSSKVSQVDKGSNDADIVDNVDIADIVGMDGNVDEVNVEDVPAQKPHFLDYDAAPPSDLEESFCGAPSIQRSQGVQQPIVNALGKTEKLKVDKKYERDGEISDCELAANGYTKKEFTQDDNTLHLDSGYRAVERPNLRKSVFAKPKHFLDENPIPPDYMVQHELREHRSLDRNFERQQSQQQQQIERSSASPVNSLLGERKSSLDRGGNIATTSEVRLSRERIKAQTPSYALSRFLSSPCSSLPQANLSQSTRIPKGAAWASEHFENSYEGLLSSSRSNELEIDSLGPKVECVYSLLSMLGSNDPLDMSKKFLELSRTPETCATLRRSGCIPLIVQMMHSADAEDNVRKCASMALHNVVHSNPDERAGRREAKVLRHLDQISDYCNFLKTLLQSGGEAIADDTDRHPLAAISSLMKVSFDEEHRHAMCELGALHTIPNLVHLDHAAHGPNPEKSSHENENDEANKAGSNLEQGCNSLRRYALMALTNLTFGDEKNKAHLCSQKPFMEALVAQLDSAPDDLLQVTASVLRNLSWRADSNMKSVLNEIGTVTALARAAMKNKNENTLKAILSALWNLSAHCSTNKAEFCAVDGALAFLVDMLTYEGPSKTLKIIENAGGILRNVSSHIAVRENYRQILRERNCLAILLQQLKSESLTVVSNSCGTLWNLSARCPEDQKFLWDNGAVPMLRSLIHSKHAMISEGSSSALKNLLNFRPTAHNHTQLDPIARSMRLKKLPTLNARKQRALEQELGAKVHSETCENLDILVNVGVDENTSKETDESPTFDGQLSRRHPLSAPPSTTAATMRLTRSTILTKSESRDSIFSAKSDSAYENLLRSHSASDANRIKMQPKLTNYNAQRVAYALKNNVESNDEVEQPIDYSIQYNETSSRKPIHKSKLESDPNSGTRAARSVATGSSDIYTAYQETDLDQPTDFSLRYPENQVESDADLLTVEAIELKKIEKTNGTVTEKKSTTTVVGNSEVLLILEDTVKCYQTEDTPYVISNAASITDLRQGSKFETITDSSGKAAPLVLASSENTSKAQPQQRENATRQHNQIPNNNMTTAFTSGSYTPEKPINYCEEGTPGYFSRYDSLSSLDEPPANNQSTENTNKAENRKEEFGQSPGLAENPSRKYDAKTSELQISHKSENNCPTMSELRKVDESAAARTATTSSNINSAQETPLMFSRHSSMDSLIAEDDDAAHCDDKSSVVSDFSRLASGVISPSDIPDSPTQSMPQSPRRNSDIASGHPAFITTSDSVSPINPRSSGASGIRSSTERRPLRSVFEDDLNTFHVENTPAQFSCATSLSNLSIVDDLVSLPGNSTLNQENAVRRSAKPEEEIVSGVENMSLQGNVVSEGEEESTTNNDDILLANCINMGMHRSAAGGTEKGTLNQKYVSKGAENLQTSFHETTQQYCTEDTPALLSKVGSNSNLSAISICSSNANMEKDEFNLLENAEMSRKAEQRRSLNLSDDVSSNASESGAGIGQSMDILQQCIRDGMKKKPSNRSSGNSGMISMKPICDGSSSVHQDPIAMMRRGGSALPRYLPVADEMNKYLVEDSPCNFSVVSGLSNLTVGSSLVGPAIQLEENDGAPKESSNAQKAPEVAPRTGREEQWQDDSLSSLSIESEDDTNLLSQAIAAGCNRPKSNLGFSSTSAIGSKRSNSLSASQPIPIKHGITAAHAASRHLYRQQQSDRVRRTSNIDNNVNGNESYSSVESSDSNDNQSKSLLELCILTGMHKTRESAHSSSSRSRHNQHHHHSRAPLGSTALNASTQSNPNLKQFDSLPSQINSGPTRHKHSLNATPNRHLRDRERKDEKLLLECINTGISKKISGSSLRPAATAIENFNIENRLLGIVGSECAMVNCVQPKNVQATSVAALDVEEVELNRANTTITAASDVEKTHHESHQHQYQYRQDINNINIVQRQQSKTFNDILGDTTEDQESLAMIRSEAAVLAAESHRNQANACARMNDIGYNGEVDSEMSKSFENTNSDDSNESFIIETTVSLLDQQTQQQTTTSSMVTEKHKDPDLMLKSVERLTLEFVSSAEQFLTNSSSEYTQKERRQDSISLGGGPSNNTWNEDTHPNDVSFPSVSVTAPIVDSLTCDDVNDEDDDLATQADHKEFHDFAEITPTNEEQPQPSLLCLIDDEVDMYAASLTPQLNSLDIESETLINDISFFSQGHEIANESQNVSTGNSNSINFKLGGAVQTAAAAVPGTGRHFSFTHSGAHTHLLSGMTNSTLIANEARAIAENLLKLNNEDDEDLTFSINSLDLDNIRPPSGMESLNVSGYYHEGLQNTTQPNSLQKYTPRSPQLCVKSPKFPRKALPPGLVARRALGQFTGSAESVNSSFNLLDNIKPPSLMDELMDSMISVSSIQSEIVDCCESMATTISASNYETATGADADGNRCNCENDFDDNTVTLHSCCDILPCDDDNVNHEEDDNTANSGGNSGTPLATDNDNYSSAESTPRKTQLESPEPTDKRSLTPKMRRKLSKDRFKTYTIAATIDRSTLPNASERDEMLQIEIVEGQRRESNSARRRRSSQDRYKTQTIIYPVPQHREEDLKLYINEATHNSLTSTDDCPSDDMSSIKAMTKQFTHITECSDVRTGTVNMGVPIDDYNSTECEQNSETESCHGESTLINGEQTTEMEFEDDVAKMVTPKSGAVKTTENQQVKVVRGRKKPAYVSPYSMQYQRSNTAPVTRIATNKATNGGTFLRKRNTNSSTPCIDSNSALKKKNNATEQSGSPSALERQGTFVKDEPTLANSDMPVVEAVSQLPKSATSSNQSSPKRGVSRLPTKRTAVATSTSPQIRSNVSRISAVRKVPIPIKPQRSNSNTNIRTTNAVSIARNAVLSARVSATTPPSRSNSILNANEGGAANKISQAQSRIASIWKRVNDAKSANGTVKPVTSVAATAKCVPASNLKAQHTKSSTTLSTQQQQQLIRSSTFDNSPITTGTQKAAISIVAPAAVPSKSIRSTHITGTKLAIHRNLISTTARSENRFARK